MKNKNLIENLVVDALFLALLLLFTFTPYLGYIPIIPNVLTITTMHLIVLVGASLFGWKKGLLYGFFFGLSSFIKALVSSTGGFDLIYINPFISILPRCLLGLISGISFDLLKKHLTYKKFIIVLPFISLLLTFIHSFLTLSCLYIFGILDIFYISRALGLEEFIEEINSVGYLSALGLVTLFGMLGEMGASAIIVPSLFVALRNIPFIKEKDKDKYKVISNSSSELLNN